jgi:drug/metabolite transporter (DMT)-like permease
MSAGAFLSFFGAYLLFFKGPANNEQQQYFRLGIALTGLVLGIIGIILKATGGPGGDA